MMNKQLNYFENTSNNSSVDSILIFDWFLKASSSDQIGELSSDKERAKYGLSLLCGDNLFAFDKKSSNSLSGIKITSLFKEDNRKEKFSDDISENFIILSLFFNNSSIMNFGEISSTPLLSNSSIIPCLTESFLKNENKILASRINLSVNKVIFHYYLCLLEKFSLNSVDNLLACSSVNLDFDVIFSINENRNLLVNCSKTFSKITSNLSSSSLGTSNLIIISFIFNDHDEDYINLFDRAISVLNDSSLTSSSDNRDLAIIDLASTILSNSDLNILATARDNFNFDTFFISSSSSSGINIDISAMSIPNKIYYLNICSGGENDI